MANHILYLTLLPNSSSNPASNSLLQNMDTHRHAIKGSRNKFFLPSSANVMYSQNNSFYNVKPSREKQKNTILCSDLSDTVNQWIMSSTGGQRYIYYRVFTVC